MYLTEIQRFTSEAKKSDFFQKNSPQPTIFRKSGKIEKMGKNAYRLILSSNVQWGKAEKIMKLNFCK